MSFPNSTNDSLLIHFQRHVHDFALEQLLELHEGMLLRMKQGTPMLGDPYTDQQAATYVANRIAYRKRAEAEAAERIAREHHVTLDVAKNYITRQRERARPKAAPTQTPEQSFTAQVAELSKAHGVTEKIAEAYLRRRDNQPQSAPEPSPFLDEKLEARREREELDKWYQQQIRK